MGGGTTPCRVRVGTFGLAAMSRLLRTVPWMARLSSLHNRPVIVVIGLLLCHLGLMALSFGLIEGERRHAAEDAQRVSAERSDAAILESNVYDQQLSVDEYLLTGAPAAAARYSSAVAGAQAIAHGIIGDPVAPGVLDAVTSVEFAQAEWRAQVGDPAIGARSPGGTAAAPGSAPAVRRAESVHQALLELDHQLDLVDASLLARQDDLASVRGLAVASGVGALLLAAALALVLVRRHERLTELNAVRHAVLTRPSLVTSSAPEDTAIAASNLERLGLLVHPDASVFHVLTRSGDRALPEAITGEAFAEVLPSATLSLCPGIVDGGPVVTDDIAASGRGCPAFPVRRGTLACIPLAGPDQLGAIHLHWHDPDSLPGERRADVAQVAREAAQALTNHRLETLLHEDAATDQPTGLANRPAFHRAVADALAARTEDHPVALVILAINAFDDLVGRFGEAAGDEGLRAFAGVLQSCMRTGDIAARLRGEEFAVLLPGVDAPGADAIAERIRQRTEATIVSFAPGITARIGVTAGSAIAPDDGTDTSTLMREAARALRATRDAERTLSTRQDRPRTLVRTRTARH